jgi:hypothetical protein
MKKVFILITCLISFLLVISLLLLFIPGPAIRLYVGHLARSRGLEVSSPALDISLLKEWRFRDVTISGKKGNTVRIEKLTIYPRLLHLLRGQLRLGLAAEGIKFYKSLPLLDAVSGLLSIPPFGRIPIDRVETDLFLKRNILKMENVKVLSRDVRIYGAGSLNTGAGDIDCRLKFLFSSRVTDAMNKTAKAILLRYESPGWMGLNIKTSGNYRRPRIRLDSDFLKLNIKGATP